MVYPAIVSVTMVGATIGGIAFILDNQIDKLEHGLGLRMDKLEHGLGVRMESLEHEMGVISSQQRRFQTMAMIWVTNGKVTRRWRANT